MDTLGTPSSPRFAGVRADSLGWLLTSVQLTAASHFPGELPPGIRSILDALEAAVTEATRHTGELARMLYLDGSDTIDYVDRLGRPCKDTRVAQEDEEEHPWAETGRDPEGDEEDQEGA